MALALPLPFSTVTEVQKQRFWKKVQRRNSDECWLWTAARKGKGYGVMKMNKVNVGSTRVGWLIVHDADPYPLHVLHRCDNPLCHNPDHWFLGTNEENIVDKSRKLRNGQKLTPDQVARIKMCLRTTDRSQKSIADEFGVNQTLVSFISRGKYWIHA